MDFILDFFVKIIGISAASGLFYQNSEIKIIADNSNYFYSYSIADSSLHKTLLLDNFGNNDLVDKKEKLDLESMFKSEESYYLLSSGSGSHENRNQLFIINEKTKTTSRNNIKYLYDILREELHFDAYDLNIEGYFTHDGYIYLLNRGNGPNNKNGIIIAHASLTEKPTFIPIDLSSIDPHLTFTDGILLNKKLYFLAAIERNNSTYTDGEIGGSYLGVIDINTFNLDSTIQISRSNKFEGITVYQQNDKLIEFLLCEDPDKDTNESIIYKLTLFK